MRNLDKRQWLFVILVVVVVFSAAFGLSFTGRDAAPPAAIRPQLVSAESGRDRAACASPATYAQLKEVLFEDALKVRMQDDDNLDTLANHSVVRMENPVVSSRDEDLNVTVCEGRFILELPPGVEGAFGGQRRLVADINYAAQAAADGSGPVYQINGAEAIIAKLADFNMKGGSYVTPEPKFAEAAPLPEPMLGMGGPDEVLPAEEDRAIAARPQSEIRNDRATRVERQQQAQAAQAAEERERKERRLARAERAKEAKRPTAAIQRAERTRQAEARPARGNSRPSFNCRNARTRSERMVCGSGRLAARDREMSAMFYSALADADPRTRRQLRRTRDRFLAYRDRCASEDCVADAYVGRMAEIDDIMVGE